MAALSAALELSEGRWRDRFEHITVYQRGWRLGGKGASSRGPHGRIEEHGLHLLLGIFDETFDTMRRCYGELDRRSTDPQSPILTWNDAVAPANHVGLTDRERGQWVPWVASFTATSGQPGDGGARPWTVLDLVVRSVRLLADFYRSLADRPVPNGGSVYLSSSPTRRRATGGRGSATATGTLRGVGLTGVALLLEVLRRVEALQAADLVPSQVEAALAPILEGLSAAAKNVLDSEPGARRTYELVELLTANLVGVVADRLLTNPDGFAAINHLDYREWLLRHGIDRAALESAWFRGMSDLVFGYEGGDTTRPRFSAGVGLQLASRMFFSYSGSLFWRMQGGMGEVVFAPLYEVLRARGVQFRFFHRVDGLRLSDDRRSVQAIEVGVQAEPERGPDGYDPLVRVKGLPCWPAGPILEQLRDSDRVAGIDLESFWSPKHDASSTTLESGRDFDVVVFGISLGMVPHVCSELVTHAPRWRSMVEHVGTVATQSLQLWLRSTVRELGWRGPEQVTVSGFVEPFDTWASMGHLLALEDWPASDQPRAIAYFCSTLAPTPSSAGVVDPSAEHAAVRERARQFLDRHIGVLWPGAAGAEGFRWELLCNGSPAGAPDGSPGLDHQYWRANVDPSDLYVQSLPGTDQYRIRPGDTGFDNLVIAGDWTDCGLNAGCIEAATRSGRLAAAAVRELAGAVAPAKQPHE
jgi:uncharacterized protein with NAD-binding domain and iron-sulfur cluster